MPAEPDLNAVQFGVIGEGCSQDDLSGDSCKVTLTPEQFELLTDNLGELLRWFKEATFQLRYYRKEESLTHD